MKPTVKSAISAHSASLTCNLNSLTCKLNVVFHTHLVLHATFICFTQTRVSLVTKMEQTDRIERWSGARFNKQEVSCDRFTEFSSPEKRTLRCIVCSCTKYAFPCYHWNFSGQTKSNNFIHNSTVRDNGRSHLENHVNWEHSFSKQSRAQTLFLDYPQLYFSSILRFNSMR